ncbi:polyketide synthase [Metarhizium robertsii]|uniref:Non-reducing polyketide synthase subA n=2 Tax=Metarhizium robertsii TaxID=568076 RepID=SUBA_METRA|nr:BcPKS18, polyketide synthase [Metarhizium robertsii ARSEF 23]E9F5E7.1 RecName: Full=Non-reducing polyketide synthase subA; AltName: Full=Subglutinol biosynthesis cluster protein A [Metarhizium robertsii ARSEF 23]EFY96950.1 BcPKS18, polyketide synthase [Metarhizium robertsii ARSEF 23]EXU95681.1 polyketide synthase [Metarhizium robertsii]
MRVNTPSLLICGPMISQADAAYLPQVRSSLVHNKDLSYLREAVSELPNLWLRLVREEPSLGEIDVALFLDNLSQWVKGNSTQPTASRDSRNTQWAVLTVLVHIVEYMEYLDNFSSRDEDGCGHLDAHAALLDHLHDGGIQGLCIGLLTALALACAPSHAEIAKYGAVAVRLALCCGAYIDLNEAKSPAKTICVTTRWPGDDGDDKGDIDRKCDEQLQAILDTYPDAYKSVQTDVSTVTITTNEGDVLALLGELEKGGATSKRIDLHGRYHYGGNQAALLKLLQLSKALPMLQFPRGSRLVVPVRNNCSGSIVEDNTALHEMALRCILVENAEWLKTISSSISANTRQAQLLVLGPVNCVPRSLLLRSPQPISLSVSGKADNIYPDQSIAIIGSSCCFPGAENPRQLWEFIRTKQTHGVVDAAGSFDCSFFRKSPREAEYMDPQQRLGLHLAQEALESGGYFSPSSSATKNVGCYLGISSCDYEDNVNSHPPTAYSFTGTARAFASGRISHFFGLTGPSMVIDTACSSSGVAINTACRAIQSGECTMALAGGINLISREARTQENLAAASFLSPTGECRPFDSKANGYRRGEGGGLVLLKKLSSAVADGDVVLGVIAATAVNQSEGNKSITLPSSESQTSLYQRVLESANLKPRHISYVEAHGTGTQKGDPIECQSIRTVFGGTVRPACRQLHVGSIKSNIGHSEAASGIAALLKVLQMLHHRVIPPQANFEELNPAISPLHDDNIEISRHTKPWEERFRAALVNNYGASGTNAAMLVCQPPSIQHRLPLFPNRPCHYPILLTSHSNESLQLYCRNILRFIENQNNVVSDEEVLANTAFHLAQRQDHSLSFRLTFSVSSIEELKLKLQQQSTSQSYKDGPIQKHSAQPVVVVLAGQTGRRVRLSHEIYASSELLQRHLGRCDRALQTMGFASLFPGIFDTEPLEDLVQAHCMLFSLQYSVAMSWIDSGLKIDALVGHSLGQLTALCISGMLSLQDGLKLISGRASLIQSKWGAECGAMLSVDADAETVQNLADSLPAGYKVEIACYNSSQSHVVVGTKAAITAFEKAADLRGVSLRRLAISHGFHSEMIDCILPDYNKLVQGLVLHPPAIAIEPCSQSGHSWANATPEIIARQSREPVYFANAISRLEKRFGSCIWLEAGWGSAGVNMARRALTHGPTRSLSTHSFYPAALGEPDSVKALADTTINLWNAGIRVQFWLYHRSQTGSPAPLELPLHPFMKSEYLLPVVKHSKKAQSEKDGQPIIQEKATLVSLIGKTQNAGVQTVEYSINQNSEEYSVYVRGRTVFEHLLAPVSMYIESATRAFRLLSTHKLVSFSTSASMELKNLKLHAPFGFDLQKSLRMILRKLGEDAWEFRVESHPIHEKERGSVLQATGVITLQEVYSHLAPHRPLLRRLYDRCEELGKDVSASVVQGDFIKKIINSVARYDDRYIGVRSITSKGFETVAHVFEPEIASQFTPTTPFNPLLLDNFLLIAEIQANNLGGVTPDEIYVGNGFDAATAYTNAEDSEPSTKGHWVGLYSFDHQENDGILCDIFIFCAERKILSMTILGAKFQKIAISSLKRALKTINGVPQTSGGRTPSSSITEFISGDDASPCLPIPGADKPIFIREDDFGFMTTSGHMDEENHLIPEYDVISGSSRSTSSSPPSLESRSQAMDTEEITEGAGSALFNLLSNHLNYPKGLSPDTPLGALGLDSLVAIQLQSDIEQMFGKNSQLMDINESSTFSTLFHTIFPQQQTDQFGFVPLHDQTGKDRLESAVPLRLGYSHIKHAAPSFNDSLDRSNTLFIRQVPHAMDALKQNISSTIKAAGFHDFFSDVHPRQRSLVLAYIVHAFRELGCDIRSLEVGDELPSVQFKPKYQNVMNRLFDILGSEGVINVLNKRYLGGLASFPERSAEDMHKAIMNDYPSYHPDHKLLHTTGARLADCISGKVDPLQILFQNATSIKLLEDVYVKSPMFGTGNLLLGEFMNCLFSYNKTPDRLNHIRILEIGAGTGATTQLVVDRLLACNVDFTYTFTDVSAALVASAREKLTSRYGQHQRFDMEFETLNIEKEPPASFAQSYDLVISANCIHATRDLRKSCSNIEKLLRKDGGVLCLLELTRPLEWLDCVFGLLDGWWRFDDHRTYALAGEQDWKTILLQSGFGHVDWTDDGSREAQQLRLITAWR